MKRVGVSLLLSAILIGPATAQPRATAAANAISCGSLKAESTRTASTYQWTITGPAGKTTENGALQGAPRFSCVDGAVLVVEFSSTAGHSFFSANFPDGTDIGYGRQQIALNGKRFVLPIQAKARIAAPYRAAFDYHCKLDMPADPLPPNARAECLF